MDSDKKGINQEMGMDREGEASKEELESSSLGDGDGDGDVKKGYDWKRKKGKKREGMDEEKIPSVVDYDDPRFSSLFTRPGYAVDPTHPQFKRSAAYVRQLAHKQHIKHEQTVWASKKDKYEISMLLKSVKLKSKQLQYAKESRRTRK